MAKKLKKNGTQTYMAEVVSKETSRDPSLNGANGLRPSLGPIFVCPFFVCLYLSCGYPASSRSA
jgi:hypothetical protein